MNVVYNLNSILLQEALSSKTSGSAKLAQHTAIISAYCSPTSNTTFLLLQNTFHHFILFERNSVKGNFFCPYSAKCASSILSAFKDVIKPARYIEVDIFACILFITIQKTTKSVFYRFVSVLSGRSASQLGVSTRRTTCESYSASVVLL